MNRRWGGEGGESCEDVGTLRMMLNRCVRVLCWRPTTRPVQPTRATGGVVSVMVGWLGLACGHMRDGMGPRLLGRSKVILSREDLFSVEARHRFDHLSWRKLFFVYAITHRLYLTILNFSLFAFLYSVLAFWRCSL